jgi:hypothetical protein
MADFKALVYVDTFPVVEAFDRKYKQDSGLKTAMKAATERAIDRSSIVTTKGKLKDGMKELDLGGSVVNLTTWTKNDDVYIKAEMTMQAATKPGRAMFGFATGKKTFGQINAKKMDKEVQDLLTELISEMIKNDVLKELEKKA